MIKSAKRWTVNRPNEEIVKQLEKEVGIPSLHAKILASRGIIDPTEVHSFIHMDETTMHDPFLLYDMEKAIHLIESAIAANKKIVVYGDYDADGVTSVTVLTTALESLGADVTFSIPNRFEHGYGPNKKLFLKLYEEGASLLITVDNGISGVEEVAYAKSLGMDMIITDHHEIGAVLPDADAIIHPRHPEGHYPFGELAGVGVAFKLATALMGTVPYELMELVAIGTVADLVPLRDENRYFVKEGIRRMRNSKRPAIQALARISSTEQAELTEESIGFMIGPRLNAAGRLGDAYPAVDLLKTDDSTHAMTLAKELDTLNKERQAIVTAITSEAEKMITDLYGEVVPHCLVIAGKGWNAGVVGIVASRLTEKYYRPSIVLSIDSESGIAKGSARSIEGFDLYAELSKNAQYLPHFGGHQMAAGMSLAIEDIGILRDNLNGQAEQVLTAEMLSPLIEIDVPLSIDEIDVGVLESLDSLRPFGMAFKKPMYMLEDLTASSVRKIGAAKNHMKLELTDGAQTLDAIGFGIGSLADDITPGVKLSITGDLQVNEWNGNKKPQLLIRDIRSDDWQLFDLRGMREPSRWLPTVPTDSTSFIAFNAQTADYFRPSLQGIDIQLMKGDQLPKADNIVLLDIPDESSQLEELVKSMQADRIYAHFHVPESKYFEGLPGRDQFGWYYSFLKKRERFDVVSNAEQLTKHKGWKKDTVYFMSKVFSELEFVKIEDGFVSVLETVGKRDLSEAPSYKQRERQMKLEEKLLYAPYMELKQWFDEILNRAIDGEEQ
ncbi:single-stranded-DNA-specific exonuclease RecJ [Filibacter tadaridae]|uniref:Single-stranded-DNA-specific exonuclease RecJ n=1 Tax=Filibacter tadaridae TaxID=2483811 RepID=A0A3P5XQ98_9BACL|nr:single-stranded-DNA-specific exonuclease RecJ [Filibacter tadaridae]VDC32583.1 Single-stranded-DNA-specific exonuclease RecJ [Filibacter tadaridae]